MSKCNPVSVHKVRRMLKKNNYMKIRSKGGHEIWKKLTSQVSIPVHGDVKGVIVCRIMKESNLDENTLK